MGPRKKTRPLTKLVATLTPYELFILVLSLYALGTLGTKLFVGLTSDTRHILTQIDSILCIIFIGDFLVRLIRAPRKLEYLRWGWLDLVSGIPIIAGIPWWFEFARLGRLYRVFETVRTFKGRQSVQELKETASEQRAQSTFLFISLLILATVLFGSVAVLHFEQYNPDSTITDAREAIWWSVVTITTVGYGDRVPVTEGGRIVAMIMMVVGVVMFGAYTGFITAWFMGGEKQKLRKQIVSLKQENAKLKRRLK